MTDKKLHLALLFGGDSSEHDVSKRSAHNIYEAVDKNKYDVSLFLITRDGIILSNEDSLRVFDGEEETEVVNEVVPKMDLSNPLEPIINLNKEKNIDVFFPIIHGNLGEDGTIQGLLRLLQKPYVGSGSLASGMAYDKDITKKILDVVGVRNTNYVLVTPENDHDWNYEKISERLNSKILFIKPSRQGSSIGIHKVENQSEYAEGMRDALRYDTKVLVEEAIEGPEEVEISILGNENPKGSKVGAIKVPASDAFYTYDNKFVDASKVEFTIPVALPSGVADEITDMAIKAFKALELKGMARIDFLVSKDYTPYLGEINTLPGFTNISLYPQLWEASGISYTELIDKLIELAFEEFERQSKIAHDFIPLNSGDQKKVYDANK
ncbi:D-alanine--D-alanine ligase family protein [Fructilactobacillus sanfranciscensis]|uniref:D-alanine--D-alanine ligase n=1 Tax=Fructilactobacillus sanfranciscensis TaxID=1625 RepID=A0A5C4TM81_FRUSA|nr:D-alanine--D-alanine ligase family protein [Fructilactobacillus sanfranciscensis]NDR60701.1 D-alanine--D-alanine ligase [Fructilactobacillus sanfranciscensis]NDR69259.1 D-alanine--D-alanine ligase [Fructilactobacillus sanfranciscensis]NDS15867.1 D-alanine--D-alanine ligase [Fructilactobacillus sanfranciscensis]POH13968.1 D-alanine--D-alanine ligase A [Fructilactobacillus sanfranciscensis]POH21929.1 D-alanine--D-alanine ligase A [Fructilactobacillus sanfranciscensis]